jgi:hypothetical protein
MSFRERMGLLGEGRRSGQATGFWMSLERLGWINLVPGCRGRSGCLWGGGDEAGRRHHQHRQKAAGLAGWRRAPRGLPCWGLGAVAGWPWG